MQSHGDDAGFASVAGEEDLPTAFVDAPRWVWPIVALLAFAAITAIAVVTATLRRQAQMAQQGFQTVMSGNGGGLLHPTAHTATLSTAIFVVITLASAATAVLAAFEDGPLAHAIHKQRWLNFRLSLSRNLAAGRVEKFEARREILKIRIKSLIAQTAMRENIAIGQAGVADNVGVQAVKVEPLLASSDRAGIDADELLDDLDHKAESQTSEETADADESPVDLLRRVIEYLQRNGNGSFGGHATEKDTEPTGSN